VKRTVIVLIVTCAVVGLGVRAQQPAQTEVPVLESVLPTQNLRGLEVGVAKVERASSAGLSDCPPGANTVRGMARGEEEFAIVHVTFKVLPSYKPGPLKRAVVTDQAGKTFNTAVSFVDLNRLPEYSCAIPFRVPLGTKLRKLQIETVSFDISSLDAPSQ
jgi:hypothetical protein